MNRNFKRILTLVLATLLILPVLAGCGEKEPEVQNPASDDSGVKLWYAYNTENFMQPLLPNISIWSSFDASSDTKHHDPEPGMPFSNLKHALTVSSALYSPPRFAL